VLFDRGMIVRLANTRAHELFGAPPEGLVGLDVLDPRYPVHDEHGNPVSADDYPVAVALRTGRPVIGAPVGTQRPDGAPLWISVNATPLFHPGEPDAYGVVASMIDITRYKETEQELARSNSDLSRFASIVAHDLSAPLTVITGMAELVLRRAGDDVDERSRLMLTRIGAASRSGQTLIGELLDFARSGRGLRRTERVDLSLLAHQAAEVLEPLQGRPRIEIGPLPVVSGDGVQLGQVFQNLLSNALKFSEGRVEVSAEPGGLGWQITVRDSGIGIHPDETETIFGMLARTPDAEGYPGTGIGLAVCRRIVELHGGRIWVESEPGRGATFRFTLPPWDGPPPAAPGAGSAEAPPGPSSTA
jgi:PAS domain S-box-containing protein